MKKLFLSLALGLLFAFGVNAQNAKGNWYVGTGDVANVAWTDWAISPTIGYAVTDNLVLGGSVSHVAGEDMDLDFNVKYFFGGYIAPVFNYAYDAETFNLGLGFGLKF